ncbi:P-loop containing nucleoside triphosphate hydrolase protein [Cokeromyces recurvatus]|uniref:P-loop containing nucleoside triphosphate hydrolase protein n=1 Tax=Cokeromyces recurvatus TaxID=90255 RepID=UPI00222066E6|nr:P-loop containing nucleoside triphosphate hydrolase protein [Cokeromyces recurvatus]KAI7903030.1 P-loop containing nucleoside triphosphate hydrolase protein [Cokeromyces recurvatus]
MSWDSSAVNFSSGGAQMDFSSGNAQMEFGSGDASVNNNANYGNGNNDQGEFSQPNNDYRQGSDSRPPRPEPTEEQLQHRNYNWASNRARYEYNENAIGEDGMAPRDPTLEAELFEQNAADQQTPLDFSKYQKIPIRVERGQAPPPIKSFDEADLHPVMKENIKLAHYAVPTPVQTYSVPIVTSGKDLMACAQTGSGKTAAFLIPTLSALFYNARELQKPKPAPYEYRSYKAEPLVLIIAPTRELCSQIFDECRRFTYRSSLRPCAVYGGADSIGQIRQLERGCDVLAAAPGRLMDFIQRGKVGLSRVKYLILDEADRMLDMGFEAVIRTIALKSGMPTDRQTLLYSATFPRAIRALARDFLRTDYLFLKVGRVGGTSNSITQKIMHVEEDEKREALRALLNAQPPSRTLIFVETKRSADSLDHYLYERNFPSTSIHGDRTQMEREDALLAFKRGKCPILVATAVAARGIDIRNVMHVINYDMPQDMDEYIHRIGRTARVGKSGLATSFYNDRSAALAPELTKLLKECNQEIPDFLQPYVTDDLTFDEDLDDTGVEAPAYAGQEYVPMERNTPGAPQGFNNAEPTGAADGAWDSGNNANDSYGGGRKSNGRPGDWDCPDCGISNFASRYECFKCGTAKPEGAGGEFGGERRAPRPKRDGDWDCPDCGISNFASRYECFKCGTAKPEGAGGEFGGERRAPRPRRDGDWDCPSCSAVNYASRTECFKCHSSKGEDSGAGGYGGYDNSGYDSQPAAESSNFDSGNWDPNAAAAGWGSSEPAVATSAPAAAGWGSSEPAATAPASNGWGSSEPAVATSTPAAAGWGFSEPAATTPASNGWGSSEPAAPAAPASSGWGQPAATSPAPASAPAPAPASNGWGQPAATSSTPAASGNDGWGAAPAVTSDGWGAPPASANGAGW